MVTVLIRFRVADYDAWIPGYEAAIERDVAALTAKIWRSQSDPNLVVVMETYESREAAEALLNDPAIQEEMVRDGVDTGSVQLDFLDEAAIMR